MGYTFQKLFANNYQQWNNGEYRIWRKGSEVTNDRFGDMFPNIVKKLFTLDMNNLPFMESNYIKDYSYIYMYIHIETNTCTFNETDWKIGRDLEFLSYSNDIKDSEDYYDNPWIKLILGKDLLEPLIELYNLGWIEISESNC